MFTRIRALWSAPAARKPQQSPAFPRTGAKTAPLAPVQSDLLVHGQMMEGPRERGHWPYSTEGLTPHLSRKALLGPAGTRLHPNYWRLLHPNHRNLRARWFKHLAPTNADSHATRKDVPVKQIFDAKTRRLKYMSAFFAAGTCAKYSLAMDETLTLCGLLVVRLREKMPGKKARPSTRQVTTPEEFLRQKAILHKVKSPLEPTEMGVVDDKAFAKVRAMGGDLERLFPRAGKTPIDLDRILDRMGDEHGDPEQILKRAVARGAASELRRWHEAGVMHRDIKLENILWDAGGVIALADASLAIEAPSYRLEQLVGNAVTVAPEILKGLKGEVITPASDVFSLGMTLLDMYGDLNLFPGSPAVFSLEAAQRGMAKYEAWRAARSSEGNNPHPPLDWNKILKPSEADLLDRSREPSYYRDLDELAMQVAGQCEETAKFIFDRMIRLRPEDRCTAVAADEAFDAIDKENRERDESVVNRILAGCLAADTERLKVTEKLKTCWKVAASQTTGPTRAKDKGKESDLTPGSAQSVAPPR